MRLLELEIALLDWASMRCGCRRSAEHVAEDLLQVARGQTHGVVAVLDGHVWSAPVLFLPAPAVTRVALAALADDLSAGVRNEFLDLLLCMVAGDGTDFEAAAQRLDLPALCREIATRGLWLLYGEVVSGRSVPAAGTAFEILTVVEANRERLHRVRDSVGELLPWHCRSGFCDDWQDDKGNG